MHREQAEKHWEYTKGLIDKMVEVIHYLYIEALLHGEKHREEEKTN